MAGTLHRSGTGSGPYLKGEARWGRGSAQVSTRPCEQNDRQTRQKTLPSQPVNITMKVLAQWNDDKTGEILQN